MGKKLSYVIVLIIAIVIVLVARNIAFSNKDKAATDNTVVTSSDSGDVSTSAE